MNRLDKELHTRGLAKSRTLAAGLIADNLVSVNGVICNKQSNLVNPGDVIEITGDVSLSQRLRYVSRGGLKLQHAIDSFGIDLTGKVCLDVGASTGGFTDCMLQHGASRVYAVDTGTGQLDCALLNDSRVISMEKCDIRKAVIPEKVNFTAVDVSFISLKLILPEIGRFGCDSAVLLIKPQFEFGKKHKGVITDRKIQDKIAADIAGFAESLGYCVKQLIDSPLLGGDGNREFLMLANWGK